MPDDSDPIPDTRRPTPASLLAALVLLVALPTPIAAEPAGDSEPDQPGEPAERRVAVVPLGDGAKSGALTGTVTDLLDRARYDVVAGDRLAHMLQKHHAPEVTDEVSRKFTGISQLIGEGVKSFFYKGNQTAVERLTPVFDLGMNHPELLVRRPDFAGQIFQAGLVLIRAYKAMEREEDARAVARLMVRRLPGKEPAPSIVPPKIIRFYQKRRDKLAEKETTLAVEPAVGGDCTIYINGSAYPNEPVVVSPDEPYYVTMECGRRVAPVWDVEPTPGEETTVPVSGRRPLEFTMQDGSFRQRKRAEAYLRLISYWTGIDQVLGVNSSITSEQGESVLVVRVSDGDATWSDTAESAEIRGAIARVLPNFRRERPDTAADPTPQGSEAGMRWLDWTLLGTGAASLTAGVLLVAVTETRAREVACSTGAGSNCAGVTRLEFENSAEIDRAEREVNLSRAGYIAALAAGAGLTTWGVIRLLKRRDQPERSPGRARLHPAIAPAPAGATLSLDLRW